MTAANVTVRLEIANAEAAEEAISFLRRVYGIGTAPKARAEPEGESKQPEGSYIIDKHGNALADCVNHYVACLIAGQLDLAAPDSAPHSVYFGRAFA